VDGATVAVAVVASRAEAELAYPNPIYFNEVGKGNHFAAWQEPNLFTTEVPAAFRSLRLIAPHQQRRSS
jgi:hypothetical protein